MTNAAFTRGPWGLDHYADHVSYFSPARKDDYAFRVEFPDDMPEAEAEANARLIAAAPELMDYLNYLISACDAANEREDLPNCFDDDTIERARAVIAKATTT
jgi:hypothetical protein